MTIKEEDMKFLRGVADYVRENPHIATYVTQFAAHGLQDALNEVRERAADMEASLIMTISRHRKKDEEVVCGYISKWRGKTSFCWDWLLEEEQPK